jgi:hypothetical protein
MDNQQNSRNEPQDSDKKDESNLVNTEAQTVSNEANQKILEEKDVIMKEENANKLNDNNDILQEALNQKFVPMLNFYNKLDSILTSINSTWENYRDGYAKFFSEEIRPKIYELLSFPCTYSKGDKIIIVFGFLCKYILSRINYLKYIPKEEIYMILGMIYPNKVNLFSKNPNTGNQPSKLLDDKYFYIAFKEILPDKEVENSYGPNQYNCLYKYFLEFIFQSGFVEKYLNDFLSREDIGINEFGNLVYFPANLLCYCDQYFIQKKKWNIEIIKIINSRMNFYLS